MSAILRPVRSYANSRSPILDNDPKLVQLECKGDLYASWAWGSNLMAQRKPVRVF